MPNRREFMQGLAAAVVMQTSNPQSPSTSLGAGRTPNPGGIQARITKPGMDKLTAAIPRLIKSALGAATCAFPSTNIIHNDMRPLDYEECNGLDDDCNGKVDDNSKTATCGVGVCSAANKLCVNGVEATCSARLVIWIRRASTSNINPINGPTTRIATSAAVTHDHPFKTYSA